MKSIYHIDLFDSKKQNYSNFDCGISELNTYLKEKAGQESKKKISVVYILRQTNTQDIIGYYTLSSFSLTLQALPLKISKKLPKYNALPVILLGRLAIEKDYQKKGVGAHLLIDALVRSYTISGQLGAFAVFVEAKTKQSKEFYEKFGFIPCEHTPSKLYIPMNTIEHLVKQ